MLIAGGEQINCVNFDRASTSDWTGGVDIYIHS